MLGIHIVLRISSLLAYAATTSKCLGRHLASVHEMLRNTCNTPTTRPHRVRKSFECEQRGDKL